MFAPAAAAHARRLSPQQREERQFLREAAAGSRFEAEAARMALGKSSDPGVRSLAATLINHHAAAGNELLHMLHARGMAAPMLANEQRTVLNRLAKLQGARFDREFVQEVALKRQQEDVDEYEKASLMAGEPRLKAWIDRTLPTLRYHLSTAERLAPRDIRLAKGAAPLARGSINRAVARTNLSAPAARAGDPSAPTMQFGGMPFGGQQFGGAEQLGVARPFAGRPSESNSR